MTHNFFLNLMSVFFPVICLVLTFFPSDFNQLIYTVQQWFYRKSNTPETRRTRLHLNESALRVFGVIGLLFSLAMISLMFFKPAA